MYLKNCLNDLNCYLHANYQDSSPMCISFVVPISSLFFSLQEGEMWFSEELFLDHKSSSMRQFLQSAIHLQCFKQVHTVPHVIHCPLLDRYCNYNTGEGLVGQRIKVL